MQEYCRLHIQSLRIQYSFVQLDATGIQETLAVWAFRKSSDRKFKRRRSLQAEFGECKMSTLESRQLSRCGAALASGY